MCSVSCAERGDSRARVGYDDVAHAIEIRARLVIVALVALDLEGNAALVVLQDERPRAYDLIEFRFASGVVATVDFFQDELRRNGNPWGSDTAEEADRRVFQVDLQVGGVNRLRVLHEAAYAAGARHSDVVGTLYHAVERVRHVFCGDGSAVAVCRALSHLEGVCLAGGVHFPRHGEVWGDVNPYRRVVLQDAREDVCHVRQFRDRGVAVRVGVPQVEARQRDEGAARYRLLSGGRGVRSALLGYCCDCYGRDRCWRHRRRSCLLCRCCQSGGGRCLLWRLGRSLWSRCTSARCYEQRDEGNSQ